MCLFQNSKLVFTKTNQKRISQRIKSLKFDTSKLEKSPSLSSSKRLYECKHCPFTTSFSGPFANHAKFCKSKNSVSKFTKDKKNVEKNGNSKLYACFYCKYKFANRSKLLSHYRRKHRNQSGKLHKCTMCPYESKHLTNIRSHISTNHVRSSNKATKTSASKPIQEKKNVKNNVTFKLYTCFYCKYKIADRSKLMAHYRRKHSDQAGKLHKCPMCSYESIHVFNMRNHISANHKNCFKCKFCSYTTDKSLSLRGHINVLHGKQSSSKQSCSKNKRFKCKICNYKTNVSTNFKSHISQIHNKQSTKSSSKTRTRGKLIRTGNFHCPHKGCNFFGIHKRKHLLSHLVKGPFKCSLCSFSCESKSYLLRVHKMNSHGNNLPKKEAKKPAVDHQVSSKNWLKCSHCSYKCRFPAIMRRHSTFWHTDDSEISINKMAKWFLSKTMQKQEEKKKSLNKFDDANENANSYDFAQMKHLSMDSIPVIKLKRLENASVSSNMPNDAGTSSNNFEPKAIRDIANASSAESDETPLQNTVWIKSEPVDINEFIE